MTRGVAGASDPESKARPRSASGGMQTQEAQMRMMITMTINQQRANDELFEETGVDDD